MVEDKRFSNRNNTELVIKEIDGDFYFPLRAVNINEGGMFIECTIPGRALKPKSTYSVGLSNFKEVRFQGEVVHSSEDSTNGGYGIKFTNFEKGSVNDLINI